MKYKVKDLHSSIVEMRYEVLEKKDRCRDDSYEQVFVGTLPECHSYIWLKENGFI